MSLWDDICDNVIMPIGGIISDSVEFVGRSVDKVVETVIIDGVCGKIDSTIEQIRKNQSYRYDDDLEFLKHIKSEDLNDLVWCLTHNNDCDPRWTESLTTTESYKKYNPDHNQYWSLIASELQCFGANTLATMYRGGEGVLYKEVLTDVCDKLNVNYNKDSNTQTIENNLLMKILTDAIEKMSPEELKELAEVIGMKNTSTVTKEAMVGLFQVVFRVGGFKSYQLTVIIVNAVLKALIGRGLSLAGNAALTRIMAVLTGPIGWVITGLWTTIDVAGAAYRVTIPAVIQVAALRQKHLYEDEIKNISFG